jgi:repressor LexA
MSSTGHNTGDASDHRLGRRQAQVLHAIEAYVRRHNRPPTVRDLCRETRIASTGHMAYILDGLERREYIACERGVARGIRLTRSPGTSGVPILGAIAAGQPLDFFDAGAPETLDLAAHAHPRHGGDDDDDCGADSAGAEFALRVCGDSMIEDGIFDGDYVLVRPVSAASEGAIVVAVHLASEGGEHGAATLKRLQLDRRHKRVLLCPANAALRPIEIPMEVWTREWQVQGTVTAIYRSYGQSRPLPCGARPGTPAKSNRSA